MGRTPIWFLAVLWGVIVGTSRFAGAEVSFWVDRDEITVGDRITLTVQVDYDEKNGIPDPPDPSGWKGLEVIDSQTGTVQTLPEGQKRILFTFILTSFEVGDHRISMAGLPEVIIPRGTLTMEPITVTVRSVNPNPTDQDDIRDIRGPKQLPFRYSEYLFPVLFLAALLALLYMVYRRYLARGGEPAAIPPVEVRRKAHEIALERLEQIRRKKLYEQGKIKEYYSEISDCLREYLRNRYGLYAQERTTAEIRGELSGLLRESRVVGEFVEVLSESDFVKFAKYTPDSPSAERAIRKSGDLVLATAEPEPGLPSETPHDPSDSIRVKER
jgi:hypothetical protein